ncbi:hypothetical protein [Polaromonas sp. CG9_12]|nr:hypothetical protein [Polaromonas sp. CG9_12]
MGSAKVEIFTKQKFLSRYEISAKNWLRVICAIRNLFP